MLNHHLPRACGPTLLCVVVLLSFAWLALPCLAPAHADATRAAPAAPAALDAPSSAHALHARTLLDGFEDPAWPNPDLWIVTGSAPPTWWPSTCRAKSGRRALWAFGGLVGGGELACGAGAPTGAASTIVQRLDLRGADLASRLELHFELWMQLPPGPDTGLFIFLRVPEPGGGVKRVPVFGATGGGGSWVFPPRQLDLMNLADISDPREVYDLRGGVWELEWLALAPAGTVPGAGVYIDDVMLEWEPDAAVTPPTPRPTSGLPSATPTARFSPTPLPSPTPRPASATPSPTPSSTVHPTTPAPATPTLTATSTRRPTPGSEATPTPRLTGAPAYLPWAAQGEVLRPDTPTPEAPDTPTPGTSMPTESPTATASVTPTESPKPLPLYLPWTAREAPRGESTPPPAWESAPADMPNPTRTAIPEKSPQTQAIGDRGQLE